MTMLCANWSHRCDVTQFLIIFSLSVILLVYFFHSNAECVAAARCFICSCYSTVYPFHPVILATLSLRRFAFVSVFSIALSLCVCVLCCVCCLSARENFNLPGRNAEMLKKKHGNWLLLARLVASITG